MLRWFLQRQIAAFERTWNYDASYMHEVIGVDPRAMLAFGIRPNVPHLPYNLCQMETCVAIIARTDPNDQESVVLLPELEKVHRSNDSRLQGAAISHLPPKSAETEPDPFGKEPIMTKMSPVVHFEMPAEDRKRMASFYEKTFGWKTQMLGPEMGDYVLVTTAESDVKPGAPAGAINGGFFPKRPDWPAQYPSIVIGVDDIESAMRRVGKEGGKVLGEPMQIPGVGRYVSFFDTEGNRVSMLQPNRPGAA